MLSKMIDRSHLSDEALAFIEANIEKCKSFLASYVSVMGSMAMLSVQDSDELERSDLFSETDEVWDDIATKISDDYVHEILEQCIDFLMQSHEMIVGREKDAGRMFYYNRNGHGVGFWDSDWNGNEKKLDEMCVPYGTQDFLFYVNSNHDILEVQLIS